MNEFTVVTAFACRGKRPGSGSVLRKETFSPMFRASRRARAGLSQGRWQPKQGGLGAIAPPCRALRFVVAIMAAAVAVRNDCSEVLLSLC